MSEQKHTSGPWVYSDLCTKVSCGAVMGHDGRYVATIDDVGDLQVEHANARLIAAAPELLEALRQCLTAIPQGDAAYKWELAAADRARAAIAKATGGAS